MFGPCDRPLNNVDGHLLPTHNPQNSQKWVWVPSFKYKWILESPEPGANSMTCTGGRHRPAGTQEGVAEGAAEAGGH